MPQQIINQLENALGDTLVILSSIPEEKLNSVPFKGSWTAAQVCRHIFKSEDGIDQLFNAPAPLADRNPAERAAEYKNILLDYEKKMTSPDYLVPENIAFEKEKLKADLEQAKEKVMKAVSDANFNEVPTLEKDNPLQGSTKLELIHFLAYHTIRHNHQLKTIKEKLN
ncbi:DinB family protein [Flavobacterium sp. DG1-102-2]|uniref:DinB family protein n=1 Tax=Flavobacterium sp. DG1-102-2 TaxID=3081663 RepID=UPI002949ECD0|nr:DinB family protein [Flavobacterium sp. DG1-102-2]MDV6168877.1 DinB family protein [Flavobacterium sp. DG1-102-2]